MFKAFYEKITMAVLQNKYIRQAILVSFISAAIAYLLLILVDLPLFEHRVVFHHEVIDGTALSPYRYRILIPFLVESLRFMIPDEATRVLAGYGLIEYLSIVLVLFAFFRHLNYWFSENIALFGSLLVVVTLPIAFLNFGYYHPWSLLEPLFFVLIFYVARKRSIIWLMVLTFIATLNRETGIFISILYLFLSQEPLKARFTKSFISLLLGTTIIIGLRLTRGIAEHQVQIASLFWANLSPQFLAYTIPINLLMHGWMWILAFLGYSNSPLEIKRGMFFIPIYLSFFLIFSVWYEARFFLSIYPILIPAILSAFVDPRWISPYFFPIPKDLAKT